MACSQSCTALFDGASFKVMATLRVHSNMLSHFSCTILLRHLLSVALFLVLHARLALGASPVTIPLDGGLMHSSGFIANATVGGSPFRLQIDVSQGALSLPGQGCQGCRAGDTRYDVSASAAGTVVGCGDAVCDGGCPDGATDGLHGGCPFCIRGKCCVSPQYAGGGVQSTSGDVCVYNVLYSEKMNGNGTMFRDTVGLGGMEMPEVLFGAMRAETETFEVAYADGIMGLGFSSAGRRPSVVPAVMEYFTNSTGLPGVFSMCAASHGATLVMGAADEGLVKGGGKYSYVPLLDVSKTDKYMVSVLGYGKVGNKTVQLPELAAGVWSSATTSMAIGKVTFLAILEALTDNYCHIQGLCTVNSWFRPQGCHVLSEADLKLMPTLTFYLAEDVPITLEPEDYLLSYKKVNGKLYRCVAFLVTDMLASLKVGVLFGTIFMQRHAVAFDYAARRIGIAPAEQSKCGPTTGSDAGLTLASLGHKPKPGLVLTAQADAADPSKIDGPLLNVDFLFAEECRAISGCSSCAENLKCSYNYPAGKCLSRTRVSRGGARLVFPYCAGRSCICAAVGPSGWYVGIVIGVILGLCCSGCCACSYRRGKRKNRYQTLESTEDGI